MATMPQNRASPAPPANPAGPVPLCVDMDGTLFRSDALWEGVVGMVRQGSPGLLATPLWLARGKAHFKQRVAGADALDAGSLPYRETLIEWLKAERLERPVILCTAGDLATARRVADHLDLFDDVVASDGVTNLKGEAKARTLVDKFGERGFDYVGNDACDLAIWAHARRAHVVGGTPSLAERAGRVAEIGEIFEPASGATIRSWIRALRLYQWIKNLLVFVPLVAAHRIAHLDDWYRAGLAFVAFGLLASSAYVLNDLIDLAADRAHHRKRHRPFASGELPILHGLLVIPLLVLGAAMVATQLPMLFGVALLTYFVVTLAYSLVLKRIATLDVVALAALYTLRIVAGTFALSLVLSFWLLAFSMFIFLSLALVKRYAELMASRNAGKTGAVGRGYQVEDLPILGAMGAASGYLSVLVLALYINSTASQEAYSLPQALWLLCPLLLYWITRTWLITHRNGMHDDPILFAVKDPTSLAVAAIGLTVIAFAI